MKNDADQLQDKNVVPDKNTIAMGHEGMSLLIILQRKLCRGLYHIPKKVLDRSRRHAMIKTWRGQIRRS